MRNLSVTDFRDKINRIEILNCLSIQLKMKYSRRNYWLHFNGLL